MSNPINNLSHPYTFGYPIPLPQQRQTLEQQPQLSEWVFAQRQFDAVQKFQQEEFQRKQSARQQLFIQRQMLEQQIFMSQGSIQITQDDSDSFSDEPPPLASIPVSERLPPTSSRKRTERREPHVSTKHKVKKRKCPQDRMSASRMLLLSISESPAIASSSSSLLSMERLTASVAPVAAGRSKSAEPSLISISRRVYGFIMFMNQKFPPAALIDQLSPVLKENVNNLFNRVDPLVRLVGFNPARRTMTIGIHQDFDFIIHAFVSSKFMNPDTIKKKPVEKIRKPIFVYWSKSKVPGISPIQSMVFGNEYHRTFYLPKALIKNEKFLEIYRNNPAQILPITANLLQEVTDSCFTQIKSDGQAKVLSISEMRLFENIKVIDKKEFPKSFDKELKRSVENHSGDGFVRLMVPADALNSKSYIVYDPNLNNNLL